MNYEEIEPVVAAICSSITEEPEKWEINTYDIRHIDRKFNNFDINKDTFTSIWSGGWVRVFSDEQAERLKIAYKTYLSNKATYSQKLLIDSIKKEEENEEVTNIITTFFKCIFGHNNSSK